MNRTLSRASFLGLCLLVVSAAQAAQRTFVSAATGSDSNGCLRDSPCRNFAAAMNATDPGGEVIVLDSGGYGAVTVNKSVSLISPAGVYAGISAFTSPAVTVNAGASGNVTISGLTLNSQGAATGIDFATGNVLHVERCILNNFPLNGIRVVRAAGTDVLQVAVSDTTIRNGALDTPQSNAAISFHAVGGEISALVNRCHLDRYYIGLSAGDNVHAAIRDSTAMHNVFGVIAQGLTGFPPTVVAVENCVIMHNGYGAMAGLNGGAGGNFSISIERSRFLYHTNAALWAQQNGSITIGSSSIFPGSSSVNVITSPGGAVNSYGDNAVTAGAVWTATFARN